MTNPDEIFESLAKRIESDAEFKKKVGSINAVYYFEKQGWSISALPESVDVLKEKPEMPISCLVTISDKDFMKLINGASATWMLLRGKLKVSNKGLAMKLGELFK